MSFSCAACGYRNAEVKGGGAVPLKGCRAVLKCVDEGDLLRDVLKSDTAAVTIPELDLELVHGTLGSVYTTLEGCLDKIVDALLRGNPFGDSAETENRKKFEAFLDRVRALRDGKVFPFTVIMRDAVHESTCRAPDSLFDLCTGRIPSRIPSSGRGATPLPSRPSPRRAKLLPTRT